MQSPSPTDDVLFRVVHQPEDLNACSLVLCAAGIDHRIEQGDADTLHIFVSSTDLHRADYEVACYEQENKDWTKDHRSPPHSEFAPTFKAMSFCVIGALLTLYGITGKYHPDSLWFIHGGGDAALILDHGQWYRLATALTLHADLVHLLSNCFFGGFLLHFFLQLTGNGIGLTAMLTTAVTANLINCGVHGGDHRFVGFSTAVFSLIGMLCTISFAEKKGRLLFHLFMPIMAGLALLAFLGSSGERTDLGAHLFGLLCGLVAGWAVRLPRYDLLRRSVITQTTLGVAAWLAIGFCWLVALSP